MRRMIAAALLSLAFGGCATSNTDSGRTDLVNDRGCNFYGWSFCLLSHGLGSKRTTSFGPDFAIYSFIREDRNVLWIYEGNYPQEFGAEEVVSKRIGKAVVAYREHNDGEVVHRYYINELIDFPNALHVMRPADLEPELASIVDEAIASLQYCRPDGASMICG